MGQDSGKKTKSSSSTYPGKHYAKSGGRNSSSSSRGGDSSRAAGSGSRSSARAAGSGSHSSSRAAGSGSHGSAQSKHSASGGGSRGRSSSKSRAKAGSGSRGLWRKIVLLFALVIIGGVVLMHQRMNPERITGEGYEHAARYGECVVVDGIDVSYAQSSIRDWRKVKRSGVDFVIIRGGYRASDSGKLHVDDYFEANINGAKKAGLMVGVYFFSQATSKKEARAEARYLTKLVTGYDVDLPLVYDCETIAGGRLDKALKSEKLTGEGLSEMARVFCKEVERAGYESMVYANLDFLTHRLDGKKLGKSTDIWLAQYNDHASYGGNYLIWQCSDAGEVPGIGGYVDRDFMYVNPDAVKETRGKRSRGAKSLAECRIEIADHSNTYLGGSVEPGAAVYDGSRELKEGRDYTVSYVHNTAPGTGYMIVKGVGKYKDYVTTSFMIKGILKSGDGK